MNGRLDKSTFNAKTNKIEPNAEHAEVSFDIASAHATGNPKIIAQCIAEARCIREGTDFAANGQKFGPYTYDIINQSYGQRETFASAVRRLVELLDQRSHMARHRQVGKVGLVSGSH